MGMRRKSGIAGAGILCLLISGCQAANVPDTDSKSGSSKERIMEAEQAFEKANNTDWQVCFDDPCTGKWEDWQPRWFLDGGEVACVKNGDDGMQLTAGPKWGDNSHHLTMWTKDSFQGALKIEYEYTRLDFEPGYTCIIYIQATGSGTPPYTKDITEWTELRKIPRMKTYFNNMHTYHISYASNPGADRQIVRARRYMPGKIGLEGLKHTDI